MTSTALVPAWSSEQAAIIKQSVAPGCTDEELAFFAQVCRHKGLDPFAGEIVAIPRWDAKAGRNTIVIQETVAGLRALADRSGLYNGQDPPAWCGPDARWVEVWLDTKSPPAACRVAVYRKGWDRPTVGIARYVSYVQLDKGGNPQGLWKTGADFMLWKCAEAAALKRAFKHAYQAAGINTRDLSDASRISMEARDAGLDDDARHSLVAQVTAGRTDSTRELSDQEALEVRAELARIRAGIVDADLETGEIHDQPGPDAVARTIARAAGDLEARLEQLGTDQVETLKDWRRQQGLARPVGTLHPEERLRLAGELDRRGWATTNPPPEQPPPPEDDAAVVPVETPTLDDYGDEPF